MQRDIDRFLALVRRELGADEARLAEPGDDGAPGDSGGSGGSSAAPEAFVLRGTFPDGRGAVIVRFASPPADLDSTQRRLDMLASTFDVVLDEPSRPPPSARPPPELTLREELKALCERAAALNALVIDAQSPIVWGAAEPEGEAEGAPGPAETTRKALRAVREVVDIGAIRKGPRARTDSERGAPRVRRIRHVERSGDAPFLAHSFAGIYLLVVVFPAPFDELRAERALLESMPRIERLVMALPPRDPPPPTEGAGVVAISRGRRK